MRLDAIGLKDAESDVQFSSMEDVYEKAGVYQSMGVLPNVPVLEKMLNTINDASSHLTEIKNSKLSAMAQVPELSLLTSADAANELSQATDDAQPAGEGRMV